MAKQAFKRIVSAAMAASVLLGSTVCAGAEASAAQATGAFANTDIFGTVAQVEKTYDVFADIPNAGDAVDTAGTGGTVTTDRANKQVDFTIAKKANARITFGYAATGYQNAEYTFGLTEENYKAAKLKVDIKLVAADAYDDLSLNLACLNGDGENAKLSTTNANCEKGTAGVERFNNDYRAPIELTETTEWQTVEIPLSSFEGAAMQCKCNTIPWERLNLIELRMANTASNCSFSFRNAEVTNVMVQTSCVAKYGLCDSTWNQVTDLSTMAGKEVKMWAEINNTNLTDETLTLVMAVYKNNRLVDLIPYTKTVTAESVAYVSDEVSGFTLPSDTTGYEINLLIWEDIPSMLSLGDMVVLN